MLALRKSSIHHNTTKLLLSSPTQALLISSCEKRRNCAYGTSVPTGYSIREDVGTYVTAMSVIFLYNFFFESEVRCRLFLISCSIDVRGFPRPRVGLLLLNGWNGSLCPTVCRYRRFRRICFVLVCLLFAIVRFRVFWIRGILGLCTAKSSMSELVFLYLNWFDYVYNFYE